MTLEQLRALNCIVESGSLSRAAEIMHKTQPALSMAIRKLEDEYGFKLLNRDSYRLTLTAEGKAFHKKAQEILLNTEQLRSMGQHLGGGNEPVIRLAYDLSCPLPLLLNALKKLQLEFPETELRVFGESRFRSLELLHKGEVDLAISPWWPTLYALGDLEAVKLSHFKILLVAAPQLFDKDKHINIERLKQKVHLGVEESELSIDSDQLTLLKGSHEWKTRDAYTLKQLLLAGLGWGYIPELMVTEELEQGSLIPLQPQELEFEVDGEIRLIRRQQQSPGPVASFLWNEFANVMK